MIVYPPSTPLLAFPGMKIEFKELRGVVSIERQSFHESH